MQGRTDHELLTAIAAGDAVALRELFDRHAPLMLAIARRILNRTEDAEDVVNDVFFELYRRADSYSPERGQPRTYLLLLTRSRSIDWLRHRGARGGNTKIEHFDGRAEGIATSASGPASSAESVEMADHVREIVSSLPADERAMVERAFFDGLSHTQIAEQDKLPLGTVKGRLRRALIRLRDELRIWERGKGS